MELTNEVLEAMTKCNETQCSECLAVDVCCSEGDITIGQRLTTAMLEERAKPKVWDGAPEWATVAHIGWYKTNEQESTLYCKRYTRTLPKSRIDEIAEEAEDKYRRGSVGAGSLTDIIKSAILKDREERH